MICAKPLDKDNTSRLQYHNWLSIASLSSELALDLFCLGAMIAEKLE